MRARGSDVGPALWTAVLLTGAFAAGCAEGGSEESPVDGAGDVARPDDGDDAVVPDGTAGEGEVGSEVPGCGTSCADRDGWYDVGDARPCCREASRCVCREQEYRAYTCEGAACLPTVVETRIAVDGCEPCDDGHPCTTDACADGACETAALPAGTPCGASHECDGRGSCVAIDPIAGEGWYAATPVGPVAADVFSWPQTIELHEIQLFLPSPNPGRWQIAFPCTKPTPWEEVELAPDNFAVGNWWLVQRIGDAFYATTMDYFRRDAFYNLWAPDIFWEHLSPGDDRTAPMTYVAGETYGLMVTTVARVAHRTTNERSNILLFTMP